MGSVKLLGPLVGWQECKDPIRVAFHPFKTVPWWLWSLCGTITWAETWAAWAWAMGWAEVTDHRICQQSAEMAAIAA